MNGKIKISIIVPVYNTEKYLERCIQTLVNQTVRPYEIILIDDGSTDDSLKICLNLKNEYNEIITIFSQENKRQGAARNKGVEMAKGDYIMFVDSDDYLDLCALEMVVHELERKDYDIVGFNLYITNEKGRKKSVQNLSSVGFGEIDVSQKKLIIAPTIPVCKAYRLDWYKEVKCSFPEKIIYEDIAVVPYLLAMAKSVYFIDGAYYYYVQHSSSTMHRKVDFKMLDVIESNKILIKRFNQKGIFDMYGKELEIIAIRTVIFQICAIINEQEYENKYFQDCMLNFIEAEYPDYLSNEYLSDKERKGLFILKTRNYSLFYLRFGIKNKLKKVIRGMLPDFFYDIKNKRIGK